MIRLFEYPDFKFFTVKKPLVCENQTLPVGTRIYIRGIETANGKVLFKEEDCETEDAKYAVVYCVDPADKPLGTSMDLLLAQTIKDRICLGQAHFSVEAMNAWIDEWLIPDEEATSCYDEYCSNLRKRSLIESSRNQTVEDLVEACLWLGAALLSLIIAVILPVKVNALLLALPILLACSPAVIIVKEKIYRKIYSKSLSAKTKRLKEAKMRHFLQFKVKNEICNRQKDETLGKWIIDKDGFPEFEKESV